MPPEPFTIESVVRVGDGEPMVVLHLRDGMMARLTPLQARRLGVELLEAAEASEQDGALYRLVRERGLTKGDAAELVTQLRDKRQPDAGV